MVVYSIQIFLFYLFYFNLEDLKRLNDRLVEVSSEKMQLQLKLDKSEATEVSIKVKFYEIKQFL